MHLTLTYCLKFTVPSCSMIQLIKLKNLYQPSLLRMRLSLDLFTGSVTSFMISADNSQILLNSSCLASYSVNKSLKLNLTCEEQEN